MKTAVVIVILFLASASVRAQQAVPAAEVFVGYSYLNIDVNDLGPRQSANGWEASLSGNFNRYLAAEFDSNGAYKNILGVAASDYAYLGGIRFNVRPAFVHVLVGGDDLRGSGFGFTASQQSFATAFGGGIQQSITRSLAIRASADYVITHHNILEGPRIDQNNFRAAVGIVFTFGNRGGGFDSDRPQRASRNPVRAEPGEEAILFGISGIPTVRGVQVTLVQYQSAANRAGVQVDDVIVAIDGAQVRTIREIEVAVGKNVAGSINVSYLTKGLALVQNTVQVAVPNPADNPSR